ncbi:hypothetical protein GCM10010448_46700 [Streptomyces glomeratus]|uniref:Uncharacterized protein n=1 Tax=Streptomyces glomeratus TaxID=284452 RepID=A0ABP6LSE7_9ACTN
MRGAGARQRAALLEHLETVAYDPGGQLCGGPCARGTRGAHGGQAWLSARRPCAEGRGGVGLPTAGDGYRRWGAFAFRPRQDGELLLRRR